jgi:hypothetical protein
MRREGLELYNDFRFIYREIFNICYVIIDINSLEKRPKMYLVFSRKRRRYHFPQLNINPKHILTRETVVRWVLHISYK